jgi:hypothetical protein
MRGSTELEVGIAVPPLAWRIHFASPGYCDGSVTWKNRSMFSGSICGRIQSTKAMAWRVMSAP